MSKTEIEPKESQNNCEFSKENYLNCCSCGNGSKIIAQESRRKYILENPSRKAVCRIRVDQCVITSSQTKKCDYLILVCNDNVAYLVELKGRDFLGSVRQLASTIDELRLLFPILPKRIYARAVLTKSPSVKAITNDPDVLNLKKKLRKVNGDFKYGTNQYRTDQA
ncbi:MAG: hypothetical protein ACPGVO_09660 [Spirulinaceae cyanobacterium]